MKKYPKPKIDEKGRPEYYCRSFPYPFLEIDTGEDLEDIISEIKEVEDKTIFLSLFKKEFSKQPEKYRFEFRDVYDEIEYQLNECKSFLGAKKYNAINKSNDYKLNNELYDLENNWMIIDSMENGTSIKKITADDKKNINPRSRDFNVYTAAFEIWKTNQNKSFRKCLKEAIEKESLSVPDFEKFYNKAGKWKIRQMAKKK